MGQEEQRVEWQLKNGIYGYKIMHILCNRRAWVSTPGQWHVFAWRCFGCGEMAPNHLIIQWKILEGK